MPSRSDVSASSDRSSRRFSDATADGIEGSLQAGAHRATNSKLDRGEIRRHQLGVLGLDETATTEDVAIAHHRLVSDLTPGPDANHTRVELALVMLEEVNQAYRWLKMSAVA